MTGKLYVLPSVLSPDNLETLSLEALELLEQLHCFAVENVKTTRRMIRSFGIQTNFDDCEFYNIHHKNDETELSMAYSRAIEQLKEGVDVGILSEAGMAGMADPGSRLVARAHQNGISVKPIVGPSSVLLALCASGFNGQQFTFHGYLPIEGRHRRAELKSLEEEVNRSTETQLFMETPYRNKQLFSALTEHLQHDTLLCIACNLTAENEFIRTQTISKWKQSAPDIHKQPAIFILGKW